MDNQKTASDEDLARQLDEARAERDRMRKLLFQSQRTEFLAGFAVGLVHEFNNILGVILGYAELGQAKTQNDEDLSGLFAGIEDAALRAGELAGQIMVGSDPESDKKKLLDPALVAKGIEKLLAASLPSNIDIFADFSPGRGRISVVPAALHQALMDLCIFASGKLGLSGGALILRIGRVDYTIKDPPDKEMARDEYIQISVDYHCSPRAGNGSDQFALELMGAGANGKNGSSGLALAKQTAKAHNGALTVETDGETGGRISLFLPIASDRPKQRPGPFADLPGGSESLLIVDDEINLLIPWKAALTDIGYKVATAQSGRAALLLFAENPAGFDLVITDRTMPIMPGERLAREIHKIRPDIPVIMCTGHSGSVTDEMLKKQGLSACLHKPLRMQSLAVTIRRVLDKQ
ncbi:MAG: response regulator [Desulfatibacillaceae bacterium]|nr:response regulator [Desulfatibacillaceae bacterium]